MGGSTIGQALFTTPASIATLTSLTGGSGYVDGTYTSVPLTGGSGIGALATITVSGGSVTTVTLTDGGIGYEVGNALSASNTNLGGSGSGFGISVATITAAAARVTLDVYSIEQVNALIGSEDSNALAYAVSLG